MQNKSIDWFLYDRELRHERVKVAMEHGFSYDAVAVERVHLNKVKKAT